METYFYWPGLLLQVVALGRSLQKTKRQKNALATEILASALYSKKYQVRYSVDGQASV